MTANHPVSVISPRSGCDDGKRPIADVPMVTETILAYSTLVFEKVCLLFHGINQFAHFPLNREQG